MAKAVIWGLVVLLILLHQDFWNWNDGTLVFGFVPMGLFYHICLSVGATLCWVLACRFAWPQELIEHVLEDVESK